jgi:hypothetical protein
MHILKWLLRNTVALEQSGQPAVIRWAVEVKNRTEANARRAAISRSLRRLRERGLVERAAGERRSVAVRLTPAGRAVAESLPA